MNEPLAVRESPASYQVMLDSLRVRPGYKQTEVGMIPEEWDIKRISDLATVGSGGTPSREIAAYWNGSIPWITTSQIDFNTIAEADQFITESGLKNSAAKLLPAGTLLMALYGQGKTRGKVAVLGFAAATNQACASISLHGDISCEFLLHFLASRYEAIRNSSNTGSQENLNGQIVKDTPIVFPPLPEQRAIAAALSDVDALLAKLDQFIAKKRDLKQAAMQQLLTGQTRLPGFSGEWEVKRLGDVGEIAGSGVDKKTRPDESPVRLVNYMDVYRKNFIFSGDLDHWVTASANQARRCAVQKGDVFFTPSSETRDDIANSSVAMEDIGDAAYSYHVVRLRLKEPWDLRFRTYAFKTRAFLAQAETLCDGGGTRYVISLGKFRSLTVNVPPLPEQTAISTVLADMDTEIAALEARRDKTRALKQGMMQELLTGRIRLI